MLEDNSFSPEDFVLEESLNQTIKDLLSKLSPQQQEILTLRFGLEDGQELLHTQRLSLCISLLWEMFKRCCCTNFYRKEKYN
ncbi:MAG: hypothetical protein WBA07_27460 [Rivularia sp. (in: cyanobacteria)]